MPLAELGHIDVFCADWELSTRFYRDILGLTVTDEDAGLEDNRCKVYWYTGLPARQPFLARLDLSWPIAELLAHNAELVEKFGTAGHLEPGLVGSLIPDAENAGQQL